MDLGGLEQRKGPHDVGTGERERVLDGTVHVALGGEVDDPVDGVFLHEGEHAVEIDDVGLDEEVVGARLDVGQVGQVAGVGEFVDVDDAIVGIFPDEKPDDVRADEPGAPGDDDIALEIHGYEFCSVKLLIHTRSESVQ